MCKLLPRPVERVFKRNAFYDDSNEIVSRILAVVKCLLSGLLPGGDSHDSTNRLVMEEMPA